MTPMLLARSWSVTSLFRNPSQKEEILSLGEGQPGKLEVLVRSLEDVKSTEQAKAILDEAKPDWIVWSAGLCYYLCRFLFSNPNPYPGAGGKGGPSRTYAIDRDACIAFIRAAYSTPSITKFLLISYIGSRRSRAPWWSDDDWTACQNVNTEILPDYHKAKIEADECLTALAAKRGDDFQDLVLRPGTLTDKKACGKVLLGKTPVGGSVSRADVADVAVRMLATERVRGWFDLLEGDEPVEAAVRRVVREGFDGVEGEDIGAMMKKYATI